MLLRLTRQLARFSSNIQASQKQSTSVLTPPATKSEQLPVHLRPYDAAKYEVPLKRMKVNSGYALLELQPFPRARIIRISLNLLQALKIQFPADCIYRIYNEEKYKYLIKIADQTEDVEELENILGVETIEIFIMNLAEQIDVINAMRKMKIWEESDEDILDFKDIIEHDAKIKAEEKFPAYKKPEKPVNKFV